MTTTAPIRKLALDTLRIAPENARKTSASTSSFEELKASIRAHGVMQNLSAYDGKDGFFYVYAGGRRLTALQELAAEGAIEAGTKINCIVKDARDAAELSLVENVMRVAMHPADEFEAFAALLDQGKTEDEIASRFGVTILHIRKRMRLAAVAPQIIALYREGRITQETLMAFTLRDSHEHQMWDAMMETLVELGLTDDWQHMIDSTTVRGHSQAAGAEGGSIRRASSASPHHASGSRTFSTDPTS